MKGIARPQIQEIAPNIYLFDVDMIINMGEAENKGERQYLMSNGIVYAQTTQYLRLCCLSPEPANSLWETATQAWWAVFFPEKDPWDYETFLNGIRFVGEEDP